MGAARRGVKISCDQRGNIEGTEWNLIFSTLHCTPRRVAIDRNMSTAVLYLYNHCFETMGINDYYMCYYHRRNNNNNNNNNNNDEK